MTTEPSVQSAGDPYRPAYHAAPERGWMNDPNGLIEFQGEYHAFYQYYPHAPQWGPMHWGHVVSTDLLHWRHLPIALAPDQPYETGCFSGSAVQNAGELTLIYTAQCDGAAPKQQQCIATSRDGISFSKYPGNPLIAPPAGLGDDFRDPKVSFVNGRWHMVVGSTRDKLGCVSMFTSPDLRAWDYAGVICRSDGQQGDMWECPDLFELDGHDVLMFSPMNASAKTLFLTGEMDYANCAFAPGKSREVDWGHEFYAPQTFLDSRGRRILIAWMEMWNNCYPTEKSGWVGALTLPRELFWQDGVVCQKPVDEVLTLRQSTLFSGSLELEDGVRGNLSGIRGDCLELCLQLPAGQSGAVELALRASGDGAETTSVIYDFAAQELRVDTTRSGQGRAGVTNVHAPCKGGTLDLRLFLDRSSLEEFACGGRCSVTSRIYPAPASSYVDIIAQGAAVQVRDLQVYSLA